MHHYVYRVTFGRLYYIGVRSSKRRPEEDKRYVGSGHFILFHPKPCPPKKEILSEHETRDEAQREECRLLMEHIGQPGCMNRRYSFCFKYAHV